MSDTRSTPASRPVSITPVPTPSDTDQFTLPSTASSTTVMAMERSWGPELSGVGEGVKEKWGDKGASDEQWIETRGKRDLECEGDARTPSREGTAMSPSSELAAGTEHELEKVRSLHDQTFHQSNHDDHRDGETEAREGDGEPVTFPDGGLRAWLVVAGAGHILFATFGFVNAWGIFQDYYKGTMFPERTASDIAWIGSLQYFLIYFPAVFIGRMVDTSSHYILFYVAAVLYPVSLFLTAQVKTYWQTVLSHGVLFGIAVGVLFCPAIAVVQHWFYKRRAFALGMVACCSSLGGTFFPIVVINSMKNLGFAWTLRICGFITAYCCAVGVLTLRTRLPPKAAPGGVLNLPAFKSPSFSFFVFGAFCVMGGLYTPLSFFGVMGQEQGLGTYALYIVSMANASSLIGRFVPSLIADKFGSVNLLIPGLVASAVTTFAWPHCTTKASLTVIALINGIFQGMWVSLVAPGVASLGSIEDLGRRFGMLTTVMSFGSFLGAPVSGAIRTRWDFNHVSYYAGALLLAGSAAMTVSRWYHLKGWWGRM